MESIEAKINNDGSIQIETSGFKGSSCIKELDNIMKDLEAMGIKTQIADQKKKPEFYQITTGTAIKTGRN